MTGSYRKFQVDDAFLDNLAPEAKQVFTAPASTFEQPGWMQNAPTPDPDKARSDYRYIHPRLASLPSDVSTGRELLPYTPPQPFIWDVNGYYRAIGLHWPFRATKGEMMAAYRDSGGPDNEFATYAFKRLLDKDFRAYYDTRAQGKPVDDKYRWLMVKKAAAMWAAQETKRRGRYVDSAEFVPPDIRAKMDEDIKRQREENRPTPRGPDTITGWGYGYFLWDSFARDEGVLSVWQSMLLACLWEQGAHGRFAVGFSGSPQDSNAVRLRYREHDVIFLHEDVEPSEELAKLATASCLTTPLNSEFDDPITFDLMHSGLPSGDEPISLNKHAERHNAPEEESA